MANVFNWIRPGYELVSAKLEWNVQVPFLQTTEGGGEGILSSYFSSQETPNRKWTLNVYDKNTNVQIYVWHCNSAGQETNIVDPVIAKISILNSKGRKVFQQMSASQPTCKHIEFLFTKEPIIQSQCQQADGSYTFRCKVYSHVKLGSVSTGNPTGIAINCSKGLSIQLEGLFDGMKFSDVNFNVRGRKFPAHKSISAARSQVFEAMFEHPTKENLTSQVEIEDIEPEVFQELLRFIYTGRLRSITMETMAAGLLIAADKYLLDELKNECEKYLLRQMSPDNCVELILYGDLLNPAKHMKKSVTEAAKFFRRFPSRVMATAKWEKMEKENPQLLFDIQQISSMLLNVQVKKFPFQNLCESKCVCQSISVPESITNQEYKILY